MNVDWEAFLTETVRRYSRPIDTSEHISDGEPLVVVANDACGDRVEIYTHVDGIRIRGIGCSVCRASASLAIEVARELGENPGDLGLVAGIMTAILGSGGSDRGSAEFPEGLLETSMEQRLEAFRILRERPARRRCASLVWEAITEWADRVDSL